VQYSGFRFSTFGGVIELLQSDGVKSGTFPVTTREPFTCGGKII